MHTFALVIDFKTRFFTPKNKKPCQGRVSVMRVLEPAQGRASDAELSDQALQLLGQAV